MYMRPIKKPYNGQAEKMGPSYKKIEKNNKKTLKIQFLAKI